MSAKGPAAPAAASPAPEEAVWNGLFSLNPRGASSQWVQWVQVAGTTGTDGPSVGPSASSHTPVWKVALVGPTSAASWRKHKASVGTGSPEDGAELPQGCGWGGGEGGWRAAARQGTQAEFRRGSSIWPFLASPTHARRPPLLRASAGTVSRGRRPAQQPSCRKGRRATRASLACQAWTTVPG